MFSRRMVSSLVLSILLISCQTFVAVTEANRRGEEALRAREAQTNGIVIGAPKTYDDVFLQQMLAAAEARLATLQLLDQTGIAGRIGGVSGARQDITSFAFNLTGVPTPESTTTSNSATQTDVNTFTTSTTGTTSTMSTTDSTPAGGPVVNTVTKSSPFTAT